MEWPVDRKLTILLHQDLYDAEEGAHDKAQRLIDALAARGKHNPSVSFQYYK
jgi:hypothetical protein